ncbi:MAG TPA: DUF3943 domain-containing protein [Steroidobacteraceae bacterium]|nr:DUF3943 domain-containing protein [Steroidobacteraceae bacterium]
MFQAVSLTAALTLARPGIAADLNPDAPAQTRTPTEIATARPTQAPEWGVDEGKNFLVPAYEIPAFELLLNRFNHYVVDSKVYESPISNFRANTHHKWVVDNDAFSTNQFLHPYQGAFYQGLARSSGLNFWESSGYTFAGSLLWEMAGETTRPSINDQVASGISGSFLGEPLFRMASLLLEDGGNAEPGFWRELGAAVVSPSMGVNRLVYGKRFDAVFRSNDPAIFHRVDLGASLSAHFASNVNVNADLSAPPASQAFRRQSASAAFTMAYGLPGKADYDYERPFDYFNFEMAADTNNTIEAASSRGLLFGTDYQWGRNYRGIWGLYGSYDYFAPQIFRVSTTAGSLGTTGQWWLSRHVALQGSVLAGLGYGGGGVLHGAGVMRAGPLGDGQRDYHYGLTPQALLAVRLLFGDRVSLDSTFRTYYISKVAATESTGSEDIQRTDTSLTFRIFGVHGITLRYSESSRNGRYAALPSSHQTLGTFSIGYTLLGHSGFGAVEWRPALQQGD